MAFVSEKAVTSIKEKKRGPHSLEKNGQRNKGQLTREHLVNSAWGNRVPQLLRVGTQNGFRTVVGPRSQHALCSADSCDELF